MQGCRPANSALASYYTREQGDDSMAHPWIVLVQSIHHPQYDHVLQSTALFSYKNFTPKNITSKGILHAWSIKSR